MAYFNEDIYEGSRKRVARIQVFYKVLIRDTWLRLGLVQRGTLDRTGSGKSGVIFMVLHKAHKA
jgi:hypothetical protein